MDLHVFPIPIPPPTSLSTRSLWVFPVHQVRALVSCIQPRLSQSILKVAMTWIITMVLSLTQSQTFWSMKSSELWEALLPMKLVEVMEFQQSYLKILKIMLLKCCTQYVSKVGKPSSCHRTGKCQSSSQFPRRAVLKPLDGCFLAGKL